MGENGLKWAKMAVRESPYIHYYYRLKIFESWSVKRRLNAFTKSIHPCHPARSAQGDIGRNFSISTNFLDIKESFYIISELIVWPSIIATGNVPDLTIGGWGRWFDPRARPIFFPRIDDSHCDRIHPSLTATHCFENVYV